MKNAIRAMRGLVDFIALTTKMHLLILVISSFPAIIITLTDSWWTGILFGVYVFLVAEAGFFLSQKRVVSGFISGRLKKEDIDL